MNRPIVAISIDTEEENWGQFDTPLKDVTTRNIHELGRVQDIFAKWGARPTYLVNYAPLVQADAVNVLGELAALESVEIGAHCHPWNTPPSTAKNHSMMSDDDRETNRAKIKTVTEKLHGELGVQARVFRAGRWALSSSVSLALSDLGIPIDCSLSPGIDWGYCGGPDFTRAEFGPYRFAPGDPLTPASDGSMIQLPTTVGFLRGEPNWQQRLRAFLEGSQLSKLKAIGAMERLGMLQRRWLSPETSDGSTMVRLTENLLRSGSSFLQLTFHSTAVLPGMTPFVRDEHELSRFLRSLDEVLGHMSRRGVRFCTLSEASSVLFSEE